MRNLVRRYVTQEQRKAENEGVTEDDVNEIKNDISAFRFELIEIMRASGMNTQSATGPSGARRGFPFLIVLPRFVKLPKKTNTVALRKTKNKPSFQTKPMGNNCSE
jgi:hypothetical protein